MYLTNIFIFVKMFDKYIYIYLEQCPAYRKHYPYHRQHHHYHLVLCHYQYFRLKVLINIKARRSLHIGRSSRMSMDKLPFWSSLVSNTAIGHMHSSIEFIASL